MNEKENQWQDEIEEMLHRMEQWEAVNPQATLTDIEEAVDAELSQLRQLLVSEMANREEAREKGYECPNCGARMVRNGKKKRVLRSKGGEKIEIEREQRRCHECGMTVFPPG